MYHCKEYRSGFKSVLTQVSALGWKHVKDFDAHDEGVTLTLTSHQGHDIRMLLPLPGFPHRNPIVLKHDLPSDLETNEKPDLRSVYSAFMDEVDRFEPARDALSELDEMCKVLDPDPPRTGDLHRQIVLKSGVFLQVRIDPENDLSLPQLTFIGPDREVRRLRSNQAENADDFDPEIGLVANLEKILQIQIPTKEEVDGNRDTFNIDCGICYAQRLGQKEALPEKACENEKCAKQFHVECLYIWLQQNRNRDGKGSSSDRKRGLSGKCPYCENKITCERPVTD